MVNYVITIGREFGSQGKEIGKKLAKELGISFYDRELIEISAEKKDMNPYVLEDYDESMETKPANKSIISTIKNNFIQDKLYETEAETIKEIAAKKSCIIIGRCSDYILKDMKNAIHIFVFAPYGARYNRILEEYGLTHEATEKMLQRVDKARHNYYKRYTKLNRGDRDGKHLIIDSSLLGVKGTVDILKEIVTRRFSLDKSEE